MTHLRINLKTISVNLGPGVDRSETLVTSKFKLQVSKYTVVPICLDLLFKLHELW